jgi:hypothetical protein
MQDGELSHYEIVANSFRVVEIARPIKIIAHPDDSLEDVNNNVSEEIDPMRNNIVLVKDDISIYGYLDFINEDYDVPREKNTREIAHPITPDQIVPSSMPLIELPPLFAQHDSFFVSTQNDISHFVSFQDLDQLPMKLCLFALMMELEAKMLTIFIHKSQDDIKKLLYCLPNERLKKLKSKSEKECPEELFRRTNFKEKMNMLGQCQEISEKLSFENKDKINELSNKIQTVRNKIAHGSSIIHILNTPDDFNRFILDLRNINEAMGPIPNSYYYVNNFVRF